MEQPVSLVLPREIKYDSLPALPECNSQQVIVTPSNGNSFSPSQLIQFDLPSRGSLDPSSLYLRYKVNLTNTTGNAINAVVRATPAYTFINKLETLFGSSVVETINNYHQVCNMWSNLQLDVAMKYGLQSAYGYLGTTSIADLDGSPVIAVPALANGVAGANSVTYAVPLPCLLSQAEKLVPLGMMPNVRIQLTLENIATIFSVAPSAFTVTNIELCYSMIDFSAEVNSIVQQSFGEQFFIKSASFQNMATNLSTAFLGSTELVYNMRLASIKSLFSIISGNTRCSIFDSVDLTSNNGEYSFSVASTYYPQRPISTLNSKAAVLMELKRALGAVHSDNFNTSINAVEFGYVDADTPTVAQPGKHYISTNLEKLSTNNNLLTGISTQNSPITFRINTGTATTQAYTIYLIAYYDCLIAINPLLRQANVKQ